MDDALEEVHEELLVWAENEGVEIDNIRPMRLSGRGFGSKSHGLALRSRRRTRDANLLESLDTPIKIRKLTVGIQSSRPIRSQRELRSLPCPSRRCAQEIPLPRN